MKKLIILICLFLAAFFQYESPVKAQADYIDSLKIIPANPSNNDIIKIICYSGFSSSNCKMESFILTVNNNVINIKAKHPYGMLGTPCNSIDTVTIGKINTGNFTLDYVLSTLGVTEESDTAHLQFSVSQSNSIKNKSENVQEISVYPNPTRGNIKISLMLLNPTALTVKITDLAGREILHKLFKPKSLLPVLDVDTKGIKPGTYIVNIYSDNNKLVSEKLIILE